MTTGLPDGVYNYAIKGQLNLANSGNFALSGGSADVEMGLMRAGDANNNNLVNSVDFSILRNTFGKQLGDPGYDNRADFNRDNVVGASDFSLLRGNFGQGGGSLVCP
jgi:hypothetical protein